MMPRFLFLIIALLTLMTGCLGRTPPNVRVSLDQMQAELMAVEDRYYELEYKYKLAEQELAACRGKKGEDCPVPKSSGEYYDIEMGTESDPVIIDSSPGVEFNPESYEVIESPQIEPRNFEGSSTGGELRSHQSAAANYTADVTHILLVPQQTGGLDRDGDLSDDGIIVTLLPQDANEQAVIKSAPVMVSVIDPAETGLAQRVGIWKFSREEIARLISARNQSPRGITLTLPWQERIPRHNDLKLYVRYVNDANQSLEASMDVTINIPGKVAERPQQGATSGNEFTNPLRLADAKSADEHLVAPASVFVESNADPEGKPALKTGDAEALKWQPRRK